MMIADLRDIDILRDIPEEELENIQSVHIYGSGRPKVGLSALYITKNDCVYLAGHGSMFDASSSSLVASKEEQLLQSCKVEELSGLGVEKIVVCSEFGAALTADKHLYMWGQDVVSNPTEVFRTAIQGYSANGYCSDCSGPLLDSWHGWLSWCNRCRKAQNALSSVPHPWSDDFGVTSHINIGLCYIITSFRQRAPGVFCTKCGKPWNKFGAGLKLVKDLYLMYCKSCSSILDGRWYNFLPSLTDQTPHKVNKNKDLLIDDIAAGTNFLLMKTPTQLFIWGEFNGIPYNNLLLTLADMTNSKMSCGAKLIAVVSSNGDLYLCGEADDSADDEMIPLIMRKIPLKAPAVDVACGHRSVVCLLQNGTFEFIGKVDEMIIRGTWTNNVTLISIPTFFNEKIIESTMISQLVPYEKRSKVLSGDHSDVYVYLHGLGDRTQNEELTKLCTDASIQTEKESICKETVNDLESTTSNPVIYRDLFGKPFLSDLTIKLSDECFPAHRLVLYNTSVYFRALFMDYNDSNLTGVLDMSSYNPTAYRNLLMYFYHVSVGQLSCEDLIELFVLASSYNEVRITKDVIKRIKYSMDDSNVGFFYKKAKYANVPELIKECNIFMGFM